MVPGSQHEASAWKQLVRGITWPIAVRFLDAAHQRRCLPRSLGDQPLTRRLSPSGLSCSLLRSCHSFLVVWLHPLPFYRGRLLTVTRRDLVFDLVPDLVFDLVSDRD
jgi:hypothetical protein